jgi:quinol-cytochrome oxidoreductase complex cytochrome b subunit
MTILGFLLAVGLALVHIFAGRIKWPSRLLHDQWRSFAGGVSIAYIFLEVFPELAHAQLELDSVQSLPVLSLDKHVYLIALLGLVVFYGLEIIAIRSQFDHQKISASHNHPTSAVFWIHIAAFSIKMTILGYLFHEQTAHGLVSCLLLFAALALHFFIVDYVLRQHHQQSYDRLGRWVLASSILTGWIVGQSINLHPSGIAAVWAFAAGAIILNVLKEELPEQRSSCFKSFLIGAASYSAILLLI